MVLNSGTRFGPGALLMTRFREIGMEAKEHLNSAEID